MNNKGAEAAEFALKAHSIESDPEILEQLGEGDRMMREMAESVDLTEGPEDAVCSLVIDLMHYCQREEIDWTRDVISRARKRVRSVGTTRSKRVSGHLSPANQCK